ncbi:MAG TPA: glutamate--cysteine ligase [Gammaproteobacteria bacterium]|jgi:glutamate--cysteine ligase|nr:glutamate--cysteine ligase [Gammaproteobacteria bacterium]
MIQLQTTLTAPLSALEKQMVSHDAIIQEWFAAQWQLTMPPLYGSVDLRNAGFKLAPIDMNLFPAGFNNLGLESLEDASYAARCVVEKVAPGAQSILLIPEAHTRNPMYWENIRVLKQILVGARYTVNIGFLPSEETAFPAEIVLSSGEKLIIEPLLRVKNTLRLRDVEPDIIILNNDLSQGIPDILQAVNQKIIPPAELGWSQRLKSGHFQFYANVVDEFAALIGIDPWVIAPLFKHGGEVNFSEQSGMDCLIADVDRLFNDISQKYEEYGISYPPFVIIKADAGTYGMAVMTIRDVRELSTLNRKQRTKMATTKGGQPVRRVIVQEGVYTFERTDTEFATAEPVIYLLGEQVIGGFYRVHRDRGVDENLNSPGMHFHPMKVAGKLGHCETRCYLYAIIAQLSMLAAAREMKDGR